jgi:hypothetical protein
MLTGLSLSGCVYDIASGRVREQDVRAIYPNTDVFSRQSFENAVTLHSQFSWMDYPQAAAIARRLFESGKIKRRHWWTNLGPHQPRQYWIESKGGK